MDAAISGLGPWDNYQDRMEKGTRLLALGAPREALEQFTCALRLKPDSVEALNKSGVALARLGHLCAAATMFMRCLENNPSYQPARCNLGCVLYLLGRHQDSIKQFRIASKDKGSRHVAHYNLMVVYRSLGKVALAVFELRKARLSEVRNTQKRVNPPEPALERFRAVSKEIGKIAMHVGSILGRASMFNRLREVLHRISPAGKPPSSGQ